MQLVTELDPLLAALTAAPPAEQEEALNSLLESLEWSERDQDALRKRFQRSLAARIKIPQCRNPQRRESCLKDPEKFLRTYFPEKYYRPFEKHHYAMIDVILKRAKYGGRQTVAAPRGGGKSELVKGINVFLICAEMVRFLLPMAATTPLAGRIYEDFKKKIATNDLLYEDFPEICHPVRELEGTPQRAQRQNIGGQLTQIRWTATDHVCLPIVPGSPYGGVKMAFSGLDAAFRGVNIDGDRPDFVLVDDPETRESAASPKQIHDREAILDQDVAGLAAEDEHLAIVVLTTIQNRYCLSYKLVNRKLKPAWNGLRFGTIEVWPDRMDLWEEYVTKRHQAQEEGDEYALPATEFYLANRAAMDAGAEMLTEHFTPQTLEDGTQLTYSNLQVQWNKIADTSLNAYKTEYQNDPDDAEEIERTELTVGRVIGQTSSYEQGVIPPDSRIVTMGVDMGKYKCHWVKIAWDSRCVGSIVDYGYFQTHGLTKDSTDKAEQLAQLEALDLFAKSDVCVVDAPLLVLVDSGGKFAQTVYEACHRLRQQGFYPSKGWDSDPSRFRMPKMDDDNAPFLQAYARRNVDEHKREFWLYNVCTEWWKEWAQDRFLVDPFKYDDDGAMERVPGSLALFEPDQGDSKIHAAFGRHMVSESAELVPVPDKPAKRVWVVKDRHNNHWLDSTALACAAGGCVGVRLVQPKAPPPQPPKPKDPRPATRDHGRLTNPWGQPFVATQR